MVGGVDMKMRVICHDIMCDEYLKKGTLLWGEITNGIKTYVVKWDDGDWSYMKYEEINKVVNN